MDDICILILVLFLATNSPDKAKSVQLEETPHKIIDEIFGEGWWDNDKAEEWHKLTLEHNFHQQIDGPNTQIGQIEPNSIDQNPPLTESDHTDNAKNCEEQNEDSSNKIISENERKRKIVDKFHAIKDEFKQKEKHSNKEWDKIDDKIAKHLKVSRAKIYKWKKEFGLCRTNPKEERKYLIAKFDQRKTELTRDGFKISYKNELDETVAKELGLSFVTIYNWKRELGQSTPNKHPNSEQKELIKHYYEFKDKNPKISDEEIAEMLKIGTSTLYKWKRQFKRQQLHPNSVDGHSVEENDGSNV